MIALETAATISGVCAHASEVTYTITGSAVTAGPVNAYKTLAQGQLPSSVGTLYTVPGSTSALVSHILLSSSSAVAETVNLYINGTTAAHLIVNLTIPIGGSATFDRDGWKVYDATGKLQTGLTGPPAWPPTVVNQTVAANAVTVATSTQSSKITNNAAGTVAITLATAGAVDGQPLVVRFYDFTNVAQTLSWVNTENSQIAAPLTSNGSTTLPITVGFVYNSATNLWRCMASV